MQEKEFQNCLKNISEMNSAKYDKLITMLRNSKPGLDSTAGIERVVMEKISGKVKSESFFSRIPELVFGWVYVGWVRRSLIAASFIMLVFFVWQQNSIMNQIDYLGRQIDGRMATYNPSGALEKKLILFRNRNQVAIPAEDLNQLLDSLKDARLKYRDIMNVIEGDSILKKALEDKLKKNLGSKFNL
jgi:hypothetical protein